MKWNRQTIKTVVIVFLVIIVTSFFIRWTIDHDGETITIGGSSPGPAWSNTGPRTTSP